MLLNMFCHKKALLIALITGSGSISLAVQAVTLNFSASIMQGTCALSLDKNVLALNEITQSVLNSGVLINPQPFTLRASNCHGISGGTLQPVVLVNGPGAQQDGKWLFRSAESAAGKTGVMLVAGTATPSYTNAEVKPGDAFPLAEVGQAPLDKELPFFAGISCGGSTGCATVKPGMVTAHITFTFAYR